MEAGLRSPSLSPAAPPAPSSRSRRRGNAVPAAVLATCLAAGLAIAMAALIGLVGQTRTLQFGAFLAGFGVLLPLAALLAVRLSGSGRDPAGLRAASVAVAGGTVALLCLMRLAGIAGLPGTAAGLLGLVGGLAVALAAVAVPERIAGGRALSSWASRIGVASSARTAPFAAALVVATVLVFAPAEVSPFAVALAIAAAAAVALLARPSPPVRLPPAAAIAFDVVLLALAALAIVDVTGYWGQDFAVNASSGLPPEQLGSSAQIHQHFYLGPVNDILHGRALLVDANSVYGIGNAYLIAAWFQLVPFGYGPFGLLGSLFSVLMIVLGWAIMRIAAVPRAIAAVTVVVAVLATVLAPITSPSLFLNVGGFRFAPPFLLLAVALLVCRRDGPLSRSPWVLATFALFSLWSVEAIAYCGCTYLGLLAADAVPARTIRKAASTVASALVMLMAACLAAHLIFALGTRVLGGGWPDWADYASLFRAWSDILASVFGGIAEPWSRAWLIGGLYVASGVGAIFLLRSHEHLADRRSVVALVGMTATGASFLSYFVAHSTDTFLPFVAYPALIVAALWISLATRRVGPAALPWSRAALAVGAFCAVAIAAGSWGAAEERLPRTALAHLVPGGPSLLGDLRLMWSSPAIDPRASTAEGLIDRYFPADEALVLTEPDLGQEALHRSGRANLLPISYPWQDEVHLERSLPPVSAAVAEVEPGTPILIQEPLEPGDVRAGNLLFEQAFGNVPDGRRLGPLAQAALDQIRARFELAPVATGAGELIVARLVERGTS